MLVGPDVASLDDLGGRGLGGGLWASRAGFLSRFLLSAAITRGATKIAARG